VTARLIENRHGALWVWRRPEPGLLYAVGVDSAAGVVGSDPCVAEIVEMDSLEQVGEWYGWQAPHDFGRTVAALGTLYNDAEVGIETHPSPHGLAVYDACLNNGYTNLFAEKVWEARENRWTTRKGWTTSDKNKGILMARVAYALAQKSPIHSKRLLQELIGAQLDEKEKIDRKYRNDCIMAYGIALKIADAARRQSIQAPPPPPAEDFEERWWKNYGGRSSLQKLDVHNYEV
jgi:hypothetical protein